MMNVVFGEPASLQQAPPAEAEGNSEGVEGEIQPKNPQ